MKAFFQNILKRKSKHALMQEQELRSYGIAMPKISSDLSQNKAFLCTVRGILIFFASFGCIGGLISAFELPFYFFPVMLAFFLVSMLIAFIYYNRLTFYLGYVLFFLCFAISIFSLYWYVNSGYQAFMNTVYEKYSDYFYLASVREATEYITNRSVTVSIAMVFVGMVLAVFLNITISNHMSLLQTFLLTFSILQVALYIQIRPPMGYLAMLLSVYIAVGFLSRSEHFATPPLKKNPEQFVFSEKHNVRKHSYISDGRSMLTLAVYSILFSSLFLLLCSGIFYSDLGARYTQNKLKNTTDEYVKIFIQEGLSGLFNRYDSTGGLNSGQLGGVGSVRPDYETDLEVTFVPYSNQNIYLKGYTGVYYDNNLFAPFYPADYVGATTAVMPESTSYIGNDTTPLPENGNYGVMEILPLDNMETLAPYYSYLIYSDSDNVGWRYLHEAAVDETTGEIREDYYETAEAVIAFRSESDTLTDTMPAPYYAVYSPYEETIRYEIGPFVSSEAEAAIYNDYLQVPEELVPVLEDFCEKAGLDEPAANIALASTPEEAQIARLSVASALKRYFATEFYYTMAPGNTPRREDFVAYFLTEQRRGYCAHFAASSALILRYLGIPTRYAEGYCMQMSDILDADYISDDTSDWFYGENSLSESGLVTVSLTDAAAHAWIEIYLDGYGWIPYEMTPPSEDNTVTALNFAGLFSGLIQSASSAAALTLENAEPLDLPDYELPGFDFHSFLIKPLLILLLIITGLYLMYRLAGYFKNTYRVKQLLKEENYREALLFSYRKYLHRLQQKNLLPKEPLLLREVEAFHLEFLLETESYLWDILKSAAYSEKGITKEEYETAIAALQKYETDVEKTMKEKKKEAKKQPKSQNIKEKPE